MNARQQRGALLRRHGAVGGTDIDEAQGAVWALRGQTLHVRDLAPAQGAGAVVEDGQCFGLGGVFHSGFQCCRKFRALADGGVASV